MLSLGGSCRGRELEPRLAVEVEHMRACELHAALPGKRRGGARQLLHELADQVVAVLPARAPAGKQNRANAIGHESAEREKDFIAWAAGLESVFGRRVETGKNDLLRTAPGKGAPLAERAAGLPFVVLEERPIVRSGR